jgi:hypothetical protein
MNVQITPTHTTADQRIAPGRIAIVKMEFHYDLGTKKVAGASIPLSPEPGLLIRA